MSISEETLMAFADGEVDEATRIAVEEAARNDPQIQQRIESHRTLRRRLQAGFAAELSEPVPEKFLTVLRNASASAGSNVVNLQEAQAARARAAQERALSAQGESKPATARPSWRAMPAIAAGLVLGLVIGYSMWRQGGLPIASGAGGALVANGVLDGALSNQLSGDKAAAGSVRIGLSYLAKSGEYCRAFTLATTPATGLACRESGHWQIKALAQDAAAGGAAYRQASSELSPIVLKAIEEQIQGEPLDASGESLARQHRWQSPK